MKCFKILIFAFLFKNIICHESDSSEVNKLEVAPFYDTVILSDIADIINDFENNVNFPIDTVINSGSESEENIEDLLSEYQHYLDKAHQQRKTYMEKTKPKNKVPMLRHERYSKAKQGIDVKYDNYYYSNSYYNPTKFPQAPLNSPLDLFIPLNQKIRYFNKPEYTTAQPKVRGEIPFEKIIFNEKKLIELPPLRKSEYAPLKPPCFCKNTQFPCDCIQESHFRDNPFKNVESFAEDKPKEKSESFHIKINMDIEVPKILDILGKSFMNISRDEDSREPDLSFLPFPFYNYPVSKHVTLGYKRGLKYNKHESPLHKITIHKKKKSRSNSNTNKKHRKKVITFHNLKLGLQQPIIPTYEVTNFNYSIVNQTALTNKTDFVVGGNNNTQKSIEINAINNTDETLPPQETQTVESIYLLVNISNNSDNSTENNHKTENSIESDYTKTNLNIPTEKQTFRRKRDIKALNITAVNTTEILSQNKSITRNENLPQIKSQSVNKTTNITTNKKNYALQKREETKKTDKSVLSDVELLYWPTHVLNQSVISSKNITAVILDKETKKAKLNMSNESIKHNRTRALERAIFGDVNWDDVDAVAPVFMSFVGKYINGVLTFCSQNMCHSMKCAEKICVHRVCVPSERWNQRGHCMGANNTDSIASLESIMDLPSNVGFEIVDILQDKMLGKLFGKITLCISGKCTSLVVSKKNFLKSKCSMKELNKMGHCTNVKSLKIM